MVTVPELALVVVVPKLGVLLAIRNCIPGLLAEVGLPVAEGLVGVIDELLVVVVAVDSPVDDASVVVLEEVLGGLLLIIGDVSGAAVFEAAVELAVDPVALTVVVTVVVLLSSVVVEDGSLGPEGVLDGIGKDGRLVLVGLVVGNVEGGRLGGEAPIVGLLPENPQLPLSEQDFMLFLVNFAHFSYRLKVVVTRIPAVYPLSTTVTKSIRVGSQVLKMPPFTVSSSPVWHNENRSPT